MDVFMRSLISKMDFHSLALKLYKAKQLFLFLLEVQTGGAVAQQGCISAEQLLVELKAGGIRPEQEEAIKQELRHISSLDLVDFLAYRPLFILIHNSAIANPLDDSSNLCCHWLHRLDPYLSLATTHCGNMVPVSPF